MDTHTFSEEGEVGGGGGWKEVDLNDRVRKRTRASKILKWFLSPFLFLLWIFSLCFIFFFHRLFFVNNVFIHFISSDSIMLFYFNLVCFHCSIASFTKCKYFVPELATSRCVTDFSYRDTSHENDLPLRRKQQSWSLQHWGY